MVAVILSLTLLGICGLLAWRVKSTPVWLPIVAGLACLVTARNESAPIRLALSSLILLYFVKASAVLALAGDGPKGFGALLYATVWPGMASDGLIKQEDPITEAGGRFKRGYFKFLLGLSACLTIAWFAQQMSPSILGAVGIAGLLLTVHFGFSDMMTACIQSQGWRVKPLFEEPFQSGTLNEFWTRRWNLAFVQMNRILFMQPLVRAMGLRRAVFAVFLISGVLHELAISYPVMAGWGGPILYFLIQACLVAVERKWRISGRIWTWIMLLLPTPLLFHEAFRVTLVAPLFTALGVWLHKLTFQSFWSLAFLGLGLLQFLILAASLQVPTRLKWREELPRLSSLNRKLMWTYGIFIVLCIVAFGVMTLALKSSIIAGDVIGLWFCGFIAIFWGLRLIVDNFVLTHEDWPQGSEFEIGHALLTTVFSVLTLGYGGFIVMHALH